MIRFRMAETKVVARELAQQFQAMQEVEAERSKKPQRLRQLSSLIASGQVKCFDWAVAHLDGDVIRVNGNHTSYLLSKPDAVIPPGAMAVIQHYDCDSMADVVSLWGMFDSVISGRNKAENLAIYARSVPGLEDIRQEPLSLAQSALILDKDGTSQTTLTLNERNALVAANVPFVRWFAVVYKMETQRKLFKRSGVCYAALHTFRRDEVEATEFWKEVATGSNPDAQSGSRHLREYLLTCYTRKPSKRPLSKEKAQGTAWEDMAKTCIHCWNVWRRDESLKYLKGPKGIPKAI